MKPFTRICFCTEYDVNMRGRRYSVCTFVIDNVGTDTPIKNPKTIPIKVVTKNLIISLGFLPAELQQMKWKRSMSIEGS